jgi:hypothetical protein
MKISISHQHFANWLKAQDALTNPEKYLGPKWKDVLNFWIYLDSEESEWDERRCTATLRAAYNIIGSEWDERRCIATLRAAYNIIGSEYGYAAFNAHVGYAEGHATCELIASHKLESLSFLPLFLTP